ncbi:fimbrillin family protein [Parabacteroides sp. PF5-9]|uniref:fimbrillin family protein n=1 Tax=Parabacteroides sp. PF5-9 TaxID=1742404 RepID=UPI002475DDC7|nr:fimbrillin family protein [Parabacteroides sp. PF5-9]MDH6358333.1 hypothetical protein [Parabacteroides sp. PF5-9]
MKRLLYMLAVVGMVACTADEKGYPPAVEEDMPLQINKLNMSVDTRAVFEQVGNDAPNKLDAIGVLVTKGSGSSIAYYNSEVKTQEYRYASGLWSPDQQLNMANVDGTVYAWAPSGYGADFSRTNPKYPIIKSISIPATQTFNYGNEWDTTQDDLLYGSDSEATGSETHHTVNKWEHQIEHLYMQHALAKISFRIIKAKGQAITELDYVKKIELTSQNGNQLLAKANTQVTMNLEDGSLLGLDQVGTITLLGDVQGQIAEWPVGADTPDYMALPCAQAYGLVVPLETPVAELSLKLTLGPEGNLSPSEDRTYQTPQGVTVLQNIKWEKGKHYLYTMNVTDQGLEFDDIQVVGWDDTTPIHVPVE